MDFQALLQTDGYAFLRTDPRLGENIILLAVSGSYGYGTEREGSDVDLRGVALNSPSDLLGLTEFEQFGDRVTDTVIYSFNRMVHLLLDCSPSIIELLGFDEDRCLILKEPGRMLLENRSLFLTRKVGQTFRGFAQAQLRRLHNAIAGDSLPQAQREAHLLNSALHALDDFNRRYETGGEDSLRLFIDGAVTEGLEREVFLEANLRHYPLRRYSEVMNALNTVVREYDRVGIRTGRKDDLHLNKHAMHLVRHLMTGIDILERGEIITRRPPEELALLRSIRRGDYREGSALSPAYYEIVSDYERRFEEAEKKSTLPDAPDMGAIEALMEQVNLQVVRSLL